MAKLCAHVTALKALRATNERKLRRERLKPVRLWEKLRATTHYAVTTSARRSDPLAARNDDPRFRDNFVP